MACCCWAVKLFQPPCAAAVATGSGGVGCDFPNVLSYLDFRKLITYNLQMVGKRAPTVERFLGKFTQGAPAECWEWQANTNGAGYGLIWSLERGRKLLAHRFSYEHFTGRRLMANQIVMHKCDNPCCVNPSHLSVGTMKDNSIDCSSKGRHPNMVLSDALVIALLRDYVAGESHEILARRYGISENSTSDFTAGRTRTWLLGKHGCPTLRELKAARRWKPGARVTAGDVREIRRRIAMGEQGKLLAVEFGLHKATISDIKLRKIWKDI